jgi:hypothetical protein
VDDVGCVVDDIGCVVVVDLFGGDVVTVDDFVVELGRVVYFEVVSGFLVVTLIIPEVLSAVCVVFVAMVVIDACVVALLLILVAMVFAVVEFSLV